MPPGALHRAFPGSGRLAYLFIKYLDFINKYVYNKNVILIAKDVMNSNQFKIWLKKQGCTFETKGKTGHLLVRLGDKSTDFPVHGGNKELGTGLVEAIKKRLGLK